MPSPRLPSLAAQILTWTLVLHGLPAWPGRAATPDQLPLPPLPVSETLAALPALELGGQMPLPGGLTLRLAVPRGDSCSPQAAWLACPGLRLVSQGDGEDAPVLAAWHTILLDSPTPLSLLRQAALDRHGPPAREDRMVERRWGLDLVEHRLGWTLPGRQVPLRLEAVFVLEESSAEAGQAALVQRIGWSATPESMPEN